MINTIYSGAFNVARKDNTSYEAHRRWASENLKRYAVSLRYDTDQVLINYIEANKDNGGTSQIFKEALQLLIDSRQGRKENNTKW